MTSIATERVSPKVDPFQGAQSLQRLQRRRVEKVQSISADIEHFQADHCAQQAT